MWHVLQCKPQILHKYFIQKHFLILLVGDSMVYEPPPVVLVDRAGAATWIIRVGSGTSSGNLSDQTRSWAPEQWSVRQRQNYILWSIEHGVAQPSEPPVFIQTHSRHHIDSCLLRHQTKNISMNDIIIIIPGLRSWWRWWASASRRRGPATWASTSAKSASPTRSPGRPSHTRL